MVLIGNVLSSMSGMKIKMPGQKIDRANFLTLFSALEKRFE